MGWFEEQAARAQKAIGARAAAPQIKQGTKAKAAENLSEGTEAGVLIRAPRSPFVGPKCPFCDAQKLRLHPGGELMVWCFGCGQRSIVLAIDRADIAKFAEETLCRLDPKRQRKEVV